MRWNLKKIAREYELNAAKCCIRTLPHIADVEVEPV